MSTSSGISAVEWANKNRIKLSNSEPVIPEALDYLLKLEPELTREELLRFPDAIIQPQFLTFAKDILLDQPGQGNNTFTYYIAPKGSIPRWGVDSAQPAFLGGEAFFGDTVANAAANSSGIAMLGHSPEDSNYIRSVFSDISRLSNGRIFFREVFSENESLVSVYHAPPGLKAPTGTPLLGVSLPATNGFEYWRNVFWSETDYFFHADGRPDLLKNRADTLATIRHEITHSFGGAHPDDKATVTALGRALQDGNNSAYQVVAGVSDSYDPGITVMSYNQSKGELSSYTGSFSSSDELAISKMWKTFSGTGDLTSDYSIDKSRIRNAGDLSPGSNGQGSSFLAQKARKADSRDYITGSLRSDWFVDDTGDDNWIGGDGDDLYFYKGGFDFVSGGKGDDTYVIRPQSDHGFLSILDFTPGEDRIVFSEADFGVIAVGGSTLVIGSDTDNVVVLPGELTMQQLLGAQ